MAVVSSSILPHPWPHVSKATEHYVNLVNFGFLILQYQYQKGHLRTAVHFPGRPFRLRVDSRCNWAPVVSGQRDAPPRHNTRFRRITHPRATQRAEKMYRTPLIPLLHFAC